MMCKFRIAVKCVLNVCNCRKTQQQCTVLSVSFLTTPHPPFTRSQVIHIKRFKYNSTRREKLSTDVHFPLTGLDLTPYVSSDVLPLLQGGRSSGGSTGSGSNNNTNSSGSAANISQNTNATNTSNTSTNTNTPTRPVYDLIGVSNHHGSLHSGHYIAHVDTTGGKAGCARRWMCFNDSRVSVASSGNIAGPTAYVLFYKLQS